MTDITNTDDIVDVRDVIARFEELEEDKSRDEDDEEEFQKLSCLLEELKGQGGDEQWKGDWYPITLIHEYYFTESMEELCRDVGYISSNVPWFIEIDWEKTADNMKRDYSEIDFDGETYYYR